jgi:hypothetical protein
MPPGRTLQSVPPLSAESDRTHARTPQAREEDRHQKAVHAHEALHHKEVSEHEEAARDEEAGAVSATASQGLVRVGRGTPVPLAPARGLPELEQRIRVAYEQTEQAKSAFVLAGVKTVRHALDTGALLAEARSLVPRGEWYRWVEHTLPFSQDTVDNYLRLHEHATIVEQLLEDPERDRDFSIRAALSAIKAAAAGETNERGPSLPSPGQLAERLVKQFKALDAIDEGADHVGTINAVARRLEDLYEEPEDEARRMSNMWNTVAETLRWEDPADEVEDEDEGEYDYEDEDEEDELPEGESEPPPTRTVWHPREPPHRTFAQQYLNRLNGGI